MGHVLTFPADRHQEVQQLLPWYGAGTLDEADRALVDAHLGDCAECRAALAVEPGLKAAPASAAPDAGTSGEALRARAQASPAPRRSRRTWVAAGRKLVRPEAL